MNNLAPIVLFVYDRPQHTRRTLEALRKNPLAKDSQLYVFADGVRQSASPLDIRNIEEVRKLIRKEKWCGKVEIFESPSNNGLAGSIVSGVTRILNAHEKIIVLEDDIVTSEGFLSYMNQALNVYEHARKVMHIAAYMFPIKTRLPETFFYNAGTCWGWATWKRAWNLYSGDIDYLALKVVQKNDFERFNCDGTPAFFEQLVANLRGKLHTWAVKWHASIFLNNGLCLHPGTSLVQNIGLDGSGVNCTATNRFHIKRLAKTIRVKRIPVRESKFGKAKIRAFANQHKRRPLRRKVYSFITSAWHASPYSIYHKVKRILSEKKIANGLCHNMRIPATELSRIKDIPRYTPTSITFSGKSLRIVDSASFLSMYEEIVLREIYRFTPSQENPLIIDCGANIGLSVIYFKLRYPGARVITFEPDRLIFKFLQSNIETFGFSDVQLINKAVWKEETILQFWSEGGASGQLLTEPDVTGIPKSNIIEVPTIRLREYLNNNIDFLKIDIEGAEVELISDCYELLPNVNNLFIEYHSSNDNKQSLHLLLQMLHSLGFRYHIHEAFVSPKPFLERKLLLGMDLQLNMFCYRDHAR